MQVPSTTSATPSPSVASAASAAAAKAATVDYNAFLKLLVEEMKNQDPTKPSDPTQYLSQLASFSNVEQAVKTNTKLDTLLTTASLTQAETMLGRTVTSSDGTQTGKVVSVALGAGGVAKATLSDGTSMALDTTVTVSAS